MIERIRYPRVAMARTRSERAHHDVVEAAAEVLGRVGVAGFTIDEVVTRSGVAKSTIYRWWPNRQALLLDVAHSLLTPAATPNSGNTRDDLIAYLSSFATYPARHAGGPPAAGAVLRRRARQRDRRAA